jgi:hypothetical protein
VLAVAGLPGAIASPSESTARGCAPKLAGQSAVADPADDPQLQVRSRGQALKLLIKLVNLIAAGAVSVGRGARKLCNLCTFTIGVPNTEKALRVYTPLMRTNCAH